jgi:hypothetical protein
MADHAAAKAREAYDALCHQKRTGRAAWWASFEVVLDEAAHKVSLVCRRCAGTLGASNPSRTAQEHLQSKGCKAAAATQLAAAEAAAAAAAADESSGAAAHPPAKIRRVDVDQYMASADQVTQVKASLARFFYKSSTALQLVEHPDLVAAFAAVGVTLPSRKTLAGPMLDAEYARVKQRVDADLQRQPHLQMSTDGWRRGHVEQGVPLINVLALKPDGGAVFVKAEPARGVVKDAAWIAAQHLRWAEELTGDNLDKFLGIVMDNTKVCTL